MWFLNYCSPFIYNTVGSAQTIRYILYSCIAIEYLVYVFYIAKYKWSGGMSIISQRSSNLRTSWTNIMRRTWICIS